MDAYLDGREWVRAVIWIVVTIVTIVAIRVAFGVTWIDPFDAFG